MPKKKKTKKKASGRKRRTTLSCVGRPIKDKTIEAQVDKILKTENRLKKQAADLEYMKAAYQHREACAKKRVRREKEDD